MIGPVCSFVRYARFRLVAQDCEELFAQNAKVGHPAQISVVGVVAIRSFRVQRSSTVG